MRKEHIKITNKAAAVIAALSLAASGAINVAYVQTAHAENEVDPVSAALDSAVQSGAEQSQMEAQDDPIAPEDGNSTRLGEPTIKISNTGDATLTASNHLRPNDIVTITMEQGIGAKDGNGIQTGLTMYMSSPTYKNKDADAYGNNSDILQYDTSAVRVYVVDGADKRLLKTDDALSEDNAYNITKMGNGTLMVAFTDKFVKNELNSLYGTGAKFSIEADVVIPGDDRDLNANIISDPDSYSNGAYDKYELGSSGQARIPVDVRCMTVHDNAQDPATHPDYKQYYPTNATPPAKDADTADDSNWEKLPATHIDVSFPTFSTDIDVTKEAQVYDIVDYKIKITNETKDTTARGIQFVDSDIDKYLGIGCGIVNPDTEITITKYANPSDTSGTSFSLTKGTDWSYSNTSAQSPDHGTLYIHPASLTLDYGQSAEVHYKVRAGADSMKQNKTTELAQLLEKDAGNLSGQRKVVTACKNMFESQVRTLEDGLSFNLLYPSVTPTQGEISPSKIGAGETADVKVNYSLTDSSPESSSTNDSNAKIQSPRINLYRVTVGDKTYGAAQAIKDGIISDVKVDGSSYVFGQPIQGAGKAVGEQYALTYKVTAPSTYVSGINASGIKVWTYMSADNIVHHPETPGEYNEATVTVSTPSLTASIRTNETPSAASISGEGSMIPVVATFGTQESNATGAQFVITDEPVTAGQDPVEERFCDVELAGRKLVKDTDYTIVGNNTLVVNCPEITNAESVAVTYYDKIGSGYAKNGYANKIDALVQRDPASTNSNIPTDAEPVKAPSKTFKILTPVLAAQTYAEIPKEEPADDATGNGDVTEESNVVNVADVVKMKTQFNELNSDEPAAVGRDFELTVKADDMTVKIGDKYRTFSAAQLGISFCDKDEIKLMCDGNDVTGNYNVALDETKTVMTITGKDGYEDAPAKVTTIEYTMTCGKESATNYDQLAGEDITTTTTFAVTNLENAFTYESDPITVADAELSVTKKAEKEEISFGDTNKYTIVAQNDAEDKYSSSSMARGVVIEDTLSESAQKFGYRIDTSTIKVELDGTDITDKVNIVPVGPADKATEFDLKLSSSLRKKATLTVTYDATTALVAESAHDNTLANTVIATADNSRPAIASTRVNYKGKAIEAPTLEEGGTIPSTGANDGNANGDGTYANADGTTGAAGSAAGGTISSAGDIILYTLCGILAAVIIGGIVYLIVRKRNS